PRRNQEEVGPIATSRSASRSSPEPCVQLAGMVPFHRRLGGHSMNRQILEADWKHLRRVKPAALDRFCQTVLAEITRLAADSTKDHHARYLEVFRRLQERNDELAAAFDDLRRSTALLRLARMRALGLLTEEEFAGFSAETRQAVTVYREIGRT